MRDHACSAQRHTAATQTWAVSQLRKSARCHSTRACQVRARHSAALNTDHHIQYRESTARRPLRAGSHPVRWLPMHAAVPTQMSMRSSRLAHPTVSMARAVNCTVNLNMHDPHSVTVAPSRAAHTAGNRGAAASGAAARAFSRLTAGWSGGRRVSSLDVAPRDDRCPCRDGSRAARRLALHRTPAQCR